MNTAPADRIPLLTHAGYRAFASNRPNLGATLAGLRQVADARRFLGEFASPPAHDPSGTEGFVASVLYRGRFHHGWIVVDFGAADASVRAECHAALRALPPDQGGLLVSSVPAEELPEHVQTVASTTSGDARLADPWFVRQFARFALRAFGPTRVLFLDADEAALCADALAQHVVGVVWSRVDGPRPADGEPNGAPVARAGSKLAALRSGLDSDPGAHATGDARVALRAARAFLVVPGAIDSVPALRAHGSTAGILVASAESIAAHLAPLAISAADDPPSPQSTAIGVAIEDLGRGAVPRTGRRVAYACLHLLGDMLASTPILRLRRAQDPDAHITFLAPAAQYARVMELCPAIDRLVRVQVEKSQLVFGSSTAFLQSVPALSEGYDEFHVLDIQAVARDPRCRGLHMSAGYARLAGVELDTRIPCLDAASARAHAPRLGIGTPYVVFARHTVSGGPVGTRHPRTKRWPEERWRALARRIRRELGLGVVSVGTAREVRMESRDAIDLHGCSILEVAGVLANAALLVTVDNGLYHLGQGLGTPTVHLIPRWLGDQWVASDPGSPTLDVHADLPRLSVGAVLEASRSVLARSNLPASDATRP